MVGRLAGSWLSSIVTCCASAILLASCGGDNSSDRGTASVAPSAAAPIATPPKPITGVVRQEVATFDAPWAMDFLPDGRFLVTQRGDVPTQGAGKVFLATAAGERIEVSGLPANNGMLDVKVSPDFTTTRLVYFSFFEPGGPGEPRVGRGASDTRFTPDGLSVFRAVLSVTGATAVLQNPTVIWRQEKLVPIGLNNQQGGYLAFSPDSRYLFITAGCRDEFTNIQDLSNAIAKIVRVFPDGSIPNDNPFVATPGARADIWSRGHRNPYGLAFDPSGVLWEHENGPMGGDEFNMIVAGNNYGWPLVSNGRSYGATTDDLPDHTAGDGYAGPAYTWYDSVAPSGLIFYHGSVFAAWEGAAILGTLKGEGLVRMGIAGSSVTVAQQIGLGARIRTVREAPDGSIWVIEDVPSGKVVRLTPVLAT